MVHRWSILAACLLAGCQETKPSSECTPQTYFLDGDDDGVGAEEVASCTLPAGAVAMGGDCDDGDPAVQPGAPEHCDGVDENCDGVADEGLETTTWYVDLDGDGYGDPASGTESCDGVGVLDATDCDDTDATISPAGVEICDGVDQDCDDLVDEDASDAVPVWPDADADGYGDDSVSATLVCSPASGEVTDATDCDDGDDAVHPGVEEICGDGVDNDCDGTTGGCGWTGTVLPEEASAIWTGGGVADKFGEFVVMAGDLDGDKLDELVVSTVGYDNTESGGDYSPGWAWVIYGDTSASGSLSASAAGQFYADPDLYLHDIAPGGDLDGDGLADLLVATSQGPARGNGDGVPGIVYGSTTRLASGTHEVSTVLDVEFTASEAGYAGGAMTSGDVDGDGLSDALIAQAWSTTSRVYVVRGESSRFAASEDLADWPSVTSPASTALCVSDRCLTTVDLDGDGQDEVVIGGPSGTRSYSDTGAVYVVAGVDVPTSGTLAATDANAILRGDPVASGYSQFGYAVAEAGDVNGDGLDDLLVADHYASPGGTYAEGEVWLYLGTSPLFSGDLGVADATAAYLGATVKTFGRGLSTAGDQDGDGFADFLVARTYGFDLFAGAADASGTFSMSDAVFTVETTAIVNLASDITGGGDLNGDGWPDFATGASGAGTTGETYVFYGGGI